MSLPTRTPGTSSVLLATYRAGKTLAQRATRAHSDVYQARLRGESVYFSGGKDGAHKVSAARPLAEINAHWIGYVQNVVGRKSATPVRITAKALAAALAFAEAAI